MYFPCLLLLLFSSLYVSACARARVCVAVSVGVGVGVSVSVAVAVCVCVDLGDFCSFAPSRKISLTQTHLFCNNNF